MDRLLSTSKPVACRPEELPWLEITLVGRFILCDPIGVGCGHRAELRDLVLLREDHLLRVWRNGRRYRSSWLLRPPSSWHMDPPGRRPGARSGGRKACVGQGGGSRQRGDMPGRLRFSPVASAPCSVPPLRPRGLS